jgi:hypothetical protein
VSIKLVIASSHSLEESRSTRKEIKVFPHTGTNVTVVNVVRVLPHVDANERDQSSRCFKRVLVGARRNLQSTR